MKIQEETMVLFYNTENELYQMLPFSHWTAERVPICTAKHLWHVIGKFFETVYPQMGSNPLSQNIDWGHARENGTMQTESTAEVQL